jgi:protoporphyrinogen oxidase
LPLKETMRLCGQKCKDLEYTSVQVLNIGATPGPLMPKDHWIYIPDQQYRFFRVQFYSNVDPMFAPEGSVSLCVERAFLPGSKPEPDYHDHVIRTLKQWGWIQDVVVVDPNWIEFAYTWMSHKYGRPEYLKWLEDKSIISIGRYGKWKFQGIADSIMDGLSV